MKRLGNTQQGNLPAGTYGRSILDRLLIDLSWASSHLEGNTYSRLETRALIELGQAAEGKAALETQMILNHKAAIELIVDRAEEVSLNRYTLLNLHSALSENLLINPTDEWRVRLHPVEISKSVYRPLDRQHLLEDMMALLLGKASQIKDPFEQSFFMLVHLPYLQPFADMNKRTSRLAANIPLLKHNVCPLTFLGVPEAAYSRAILGVYELNRIELMRDLFVWAYERSTQEYLALKQELAQPDPLRLHHRSFIKETIHSVILNPQEDTVSLVKKLTKHHSDSENLEGLILEELRRLHEGVLSRYGLRPSEYQQWKQAQR